MVAIKGAHTKSTAIYQLITVISDPWELDLEARRRIIVGKKDQERPVYEAEPW